MLQWQYGFDHFAVLHRRSKKSTTGCQTGQSLKQENQTMTLVDSRVMRSPHIGPRSIITIHRLPVAAAAACSGSSLVCRRCRGLCRCSWRHYQLSTCHWYSCHNSPHLFLQVYKQTIKKTLYSTKLKVTNWHVQILAPQHEAYFKHKSTETS